MGSAEEKLLDEAISHQVYLERYKSGEAKKIAELLDKTVENLTEELSKRAGIDNWTTRRKKKLLDRVEKLNKQFWDEAKGVLREDIRDFGGREANWQAEEIQSAIPIEWDIVTPSPQQLYSAAIAELFGGKLLNEHFKHLEQVTRDQLQGVIRQGVTEGKPTPQITRELFGSETVRGAFDGKRKNINSFVRTAVGHMHYVARRKLYEENSDLIKGEVWVSTLDTRTSPICQIMDGEKRKTGESAWSNGKYGNPGQIHHQCRSTSIPWLKSWRELGIDIDEAPDGTRASLDGQVPDKTTFSEWLKKQRSTEVGKKRIRDIMGDKRAELYLSGKLTLGELISPKGTYYTLEQLAQKSAA